MSVIAGPDPRDVFGWISPAPDFENGLDNGVRGMRIAYSPRLGSAKRVDAEVETAVAAAMRVFESLGAEIEEADPALGGADPAATWSTLWWSAAATMVQSFGARAGALADPGLVAGAARGLEISVVDYIAAQIKRAEIATSFAAFFEGHDL